MSENTAEIIWQGACAHLRSLLHPDVFERWIAVIRPVALDNQNLVLGVDNDFYQTWLEENYLPIMQNAVTATTGEACSIRLKVTQPLEHASPDAALAAAQATAPLTSLRPAAGPGHAPKRGAVGTTDSMLNPRFSFNEFIIGPSNNFAHAAAMAVAQAPAHAYNPLFIYGGSGLGKTHLMQAIAHHVLGRQNAKVCYLSSETFTNEYIDSLQNRALVQFRRKYRGVDLLLIDDIHFLAGKERMQEEFFHTFNTLFDARRQIVMTSDRPASEIQGLEQRLVSRFEWGQVAELQPPDYETRMAILHTKMTHHNMTMPEEAVQFIAKSIHNNVRRLEGALT
ncbi:MAG: chromosomal replication initiator protein DnaA, partial [bacterium]